MMARRILIIEDNQANLDLMVYLLQAFDYQVSSAANGQEGLAIAALEQPDVIVCDIQMPVMDGYQVIHELKRTPALAGIPTIAVTAFAMPGDREKIMAAGFDGCITKPIEATTLVPQIGAFLDTGSAATQSPRTAVPMVEPQPHELPARAPTSHTILVVDDHLVNLELAASLLENFGYRILVAQGLTAALAQLEQTIPDLILSDVCMDDGSGYQLLQAIQEDVRWRSIPLIFITSTVATETERVKALALGADRFLFRPLEPLHLLAEIQRCLPADQGN